MGKEKASTKLGPQSSGFREGKEEAPSTDRSLLLVLIWEAVTSRVKPSEPFGKENAVSI